MTDTTQGGLIGAAGAMSRGLPSKHKMALLLVLFAGGITIAKKAGADVPDYALWFGLALGIAGLVTEMTAAGDVVRAWWNARPGALAGSIAIWAFALAFSLNNWMGAASENQAEKSNAHKAAFVQSETVQSRVKDTADKVITERKAVEAARRELWDTTPTIDGKQITTDAEVDAVLARLTADRLFKATSDCTTIKGPKTRAFCSTYADATAAKPKLAKRAEFQAILAKREADLAAAEDDQKAAIRDQGNTKIEANQGRNDLVLLTDWAGMSERDAETFNGLFAILAVSVFLTYFAGRDELARLSAETTRQPFNIGLKLRRWWSNTMYGREPNDLQVVEKHFVRETLRDDGFSRRLASNLRASGLATA